MAKQKSFVGRALISTFLVVLLFSGTRMLVGTCRELRQSWESLAWPTAPGTITRSQMKLSTLDVRRRGEDGIRRTFHEDTYTADVEYEFTVNGTIYKGTRITLIQGGTRADREHVQLTLDRYPVGHPVNVSYYPADIKLCVLEPGSWGGFFVYAGLSSFLIVVPALLLWLVWHPKYSGFISGL